jgi:hypothetical protein
VAKNPEPLTRQIMRAIDLEFWRTQRDAAKRQSELFDHISV